MCKNVGCRLVLHAIILRFKTTVANNHTYKQGAFMQQKILAVHDSLEDQSNQLAFIISSLSMSEINLSVDAAAGLCEILEKINQSLIESRHELADMRVHRYQEQAA